MDAFFKFDSLQFNLCCSASWKTMFGGDTLSRHLEMSALNVVLHLNSRALVTVATYGAFVDSSLSLPKSTVKAASEINEIVQDIEILTPSNSLRGRLLFVPFPHVAF